jgi:hypothetical protein
MSYNDPRPWYVHDGICDEYGKTLRDDGDLSMLKSLKIIRSIVVNIGILTLSLYAVSQGGDPTVLGSLALGVLGGYNGLEFTDYLALMQAYKEVQSDDDG